MISLEAIEAAKVVARERYGSRPDAAYLRTILEAAAPHLYAQALDEAAEHITDESLQRAIVARANAYRTSNA